MKRILFAMLALTICMFLLAGCFTVLPQETSKESNSECEHNWERISNLNESTARDKCTKCGETRLYTDPDSLPKHYTFSGSFTVTHIESKTNVYHCSNQEILSILNRAQWEIEVLASDYDYIFMVNDIELQYDYENGIFANFANNRHTNLTDADAATINNFIASLSCGDGSRVWDSNHPDDSERNPFFCITSAAFDENFRVERREDNTIYIAGEYLFGGIGNECNSFYTSDLTGDGYPELCFGMTFGTDIVDKRIVIVDYKTKQTIYTQADRENHDYYLFLRGGVLCAKETEYGKKDAFRTGVLTYQNSEITILWDSEVNAIYDRDPIIPGQPIS